MNKLSTLSRLVGLVTALTATAWHTSAQAQACSLPALQKAPCDMVSTATVARSAGVSATSLTVADNLAVMGRMPDLTVCIYTLPDGGAVRVGQIAKSSPAAFDSRYRSQSEAEITAGMGAGAGRAEQAIGRNLSPTEKATAQSGAAALVRGMQYQPVSGLGDKATVMHSGNSPTAYLITLVKDHTFVVEARAAGASREKNLAFARPIAAEIAARCR